MPSRPVFRDHTFTNARDLSPDYTKRPMMPHVFHKTEPVLRCDRVFRPHTIPPLNTHAGRDSNDTLHRPEHKLVHCIHPYLSLSEAGVSVRSKGLTFVPPRPSVNKYNVIHDCGLFFSFFEMDGISWSFSQTSGQF